MSVYQRHRSTSSVEYHYKAMTLFQEICKVAVSKAIPKTHRFTISVPMANAARSMLYNINRAEEFKEVDANKAKEYLRLAHADCIQVYHDLQCACEILPTMPGQFELLLVDLDKECTLLENKIG